MLFPVLHGSSLKREKNGPLGTEEVNLFLCGTLTDAVSMWSLILTEGTSALPS